LGFYALIYKKYILFFKVTVYRTVRHPSNISSIFPHCTTKMRLTANLPPL